MAADQRTLWVQISYRKPPTDEGPQIFTLINIAANLGSAYAASYGGLIVARIFVGVGASVALAVGGATV